jgi:hypothetical protein
VKFRSPIGRARGRSLFSDAAPSKFRMDLAWCKDQSWESEQRVGCAQRTVSTGAHCSCPVDGSARLQCRAIGFRNVESGLKLVQHGRNSAPHGSPPHRLIKNAVFQPRTENGRVVRARHSPPFPILGRQPGFRPSLARSLRRSLPPRTMRHCHWPIRLLPPSQEVVRHAS